MTGDRRLERFEERLRSWGRRPSALTPGAAAARIRARIGAPRGGPRPARSLAWATAIGAAVVGGFLVAERTGHAPSPSPTPLQQDAALPDNVVQWWLDAETPVYFVIRPAEPGGGGR